MQEPNAIKLLVINAVVLQNYCGRGKSSAEAGKSVATIVVTRLKKSDKR
jgi:hypothetical protein